MIQLAIFTATCGYVGYVPIAPGTVGSAAGLFVVWLMRMTGSPWSDVAAILALGAAGIWAGTVAERYFGGIDPGPVVIDEVVGMLITMLWLPLTLQTAIAGFVLFRIFDVIKPYPSGRLERLPGGIGVMADDAAAALYSHLVLRVLVIYGIA